MPGETYTTSVASGAGELNIVGLLFNVAILVLIYASLWRIFSKAGKPGWAAIVPIYNFVVFLQIIKRPVWWLVLILIPFVNFVVAIIITHDLSKAYGKGVGTTLLLLLLPIVGYPLLGFGSAQYQQADSNEPLGDGNMQQPDNQSAETSSLGAQPQGVNTPTPQVNTEVPQNNMSASAQASPDGFAQTATSAAPEPQTATPQDSLNGISQPQQGDYLNPEQEAADQDQKPPASPPTVG